MAAAVGQGVLIPMQGMPGLNYSLCEAPAHQPVNGEEHEDGSSDRIHGRLAGPVLDVPSYWVRLGIGRYSSICSSADESTRPARVALRPGTSSRAGRCFGLA